MWPYMASMGSWMVLMWGEADRTADFARGDVWGSSKGKARRRDYIVV